MFVNNVHHSPVHRDEAYPFVRHYNFPRSYVQRAKSLVDALVWLCLGPSCGAPGIHNPVEYVRPKQIQRVVPVKQAKPISRSNVLLPSTSSDRRPIVVVSDNSDSDEDATTPEPAPPHLDLSECVVTLPIWLTELLMDAHNNNMNGRQALAFSHKTWKLMHLFLEPPVVHVRDIGGNIVRTYTTCPKGADTVPCLGALADRLVDLLGYEPSTVCCLYSVYTTACQAHGDQRQEFVEVMAEYGMPLFEAAMFWRAIQVRPDEPGATRERFRLIRE